MHPDDGRVVSNFIMQALQGKSLTVYGDGSQTRSFCYVDDLIDGFIKLMDSSDTLTGPVNLGNPDEFTILELAEKIIKLTKSKSRIIRKTLPEDDPTQRQPDIKLAEKALKWKPSVKLEDGLKETVKYFRKLINE
jgi:UDP-glucuronate decarboxylase